MTQIAVADARELESAPGFYLADNAALAWDRAVAAFGKDVLLTGAWRSLATQERLFRERYEPGAYSPYNDYRSWQGRTWGRVRGAAAAVPGTSNHGSGRAVDVKTSRSRTDPPYAEAVVFTSFNDTDRVRFLRLAAEHGWADDEGRLVNELWHITYYPSRDRHPGQPVRPVVIYLKPGTSNAGGTKKLQAFLNRYRPDFRLKVDGVYGDRTEAAVKVWQRAAGMKPVGVIGERSRARLVQLGVFEPLK